MGKRGPKPGPTKLKLLRGNPGKRRLNQSEPEPESCFPACPKHLDGAACEAWNRFGKELEACGVGTRLDAAALEMLANCYAAYVSAATLVAQHGPVWIKAKIGDELPGYVFSPYWSVMNREFKHLLQMLSEFGMTPSSRSGVMMDAKHISAIPKRSRA